MGGQDLEWLKRPQEDITAFGVATNKKGWEAIAKRAEGLRMTEVDVL